MHDQDTYNTMRSLVNSVKPMAHTHSSFFTKEEFTRLKMTKHRDITRPILTPQRATSITRRQTEVNESGSKAAQCPRGEGRWPRWD